MSAASELVRLLVLMMSPRDSIISVLISRISSSASRIEFPGIWCRFPPAGATPLLDGPGAPAYKPSAIAGARRTRMGVSGWKLIVLSLVLGPVALGCGADGRYVIIGTARA